MNSKPNWNTLDVPIEHTGRAITLPGEPGKMPLEKAIEALQRKMADENQPYQVNEFIDAHPLEAAVAFVKAMTNLYGWASPQTEITKTMFGAKQTPPTMLSIKVGPGHEDVVQCPLGTFKLPGVDELVNTFILPLKKGEPPVFIIAAKIKKRDKYLLLELATETRRIVEQESIYRGKALRLSVDFEGNLDLENPPGFMDLKGKDELVFDDDIQTQINENILAPIMYPTECKAAKAKLKRGILLAGDYGTGKSLTAKMVARVCLENGWTFILLDSIHGLKAGLEFAARYSPAVVVGEDVDRLAEDRTDDVNNLSLVMDGVASKNAEIITILTTNHADKIHQVILRPGRLDCVIQLRAPTAAAVEKLLRVYAGKLLPATSNVTTAARELTGQIPATIRECVERAKLGMVWRRDTNLSDGDLANAAKSMKVHLDLLNRRPKELSHADQLAESLHQVVGNGSSKVLEAIHTKVQEIHDTVN